MFNVVIVDDEFRIARSIARYCKCSDWVDKVKCESDSTKFLVDLKNDTYHGYNLFLLDIDMPIRGDKLATQIKAQYSASQIVFISGDKKRASTFSKNRGLIVDILDKPVVKQELLSLLSDLSAKSLVLKMFDVYRHQETPVEKPISTADIIAITKDRDVIQKEIKKNDIALLFTDGCYRLTSSLEGFVKKYEILNNEFLKISGSTYININFIKEYQKADDIITSKNDLKFKVSRQYRAAFEVINNHFSQR